MDLAEKLEILADSAKYDVACTSSGVERAGKHGSLGSCAQAGICHAFANDAVYYAKKYLEGEGSGFLDKFEVRVSHSWDALQEVENGLNAK